jgi:hypothetical protein
VQIEIDFDVFKELTAMRESESDSYNAVLRRVLKLPDLTPRGALSQISGGQGSGLNALAALGSGNALHGNQNALLGALSGAWFDNVHFPAGTQFRATYKGQTYFAEIQSGRWVGADGVTRTSPSAAASAISQTNVNGWRFWHFKRPGDAEWMRLDALKP